MDDKIIKDICDKVANKYISTRSDNNIGEMVGAFQRMAANMIADILIEYNRLSDEQHGR